MIAENELIDALDDVALHRGALGGADLSLFTSP
jgi:hypothetical protein